MFRRSLTESRQRLLSPRIYIYAGLLLTLAWLMHRHHQRAVEAGLRPPTEESVFAPPAPPDFPAKDSDLRAISGHRRPLLLLLGKNEPELAKIRAELLPAWGESYSIVVLQADSEAALSRHFKVQTSPTAILFTAGNDEQARCPAPFDGVILDRWLRSLPQQSLEVP